MFTGNEYLYGWLSYLGGFVLAFAVWWYLTSKIKWGGFKCILRILVAVLFLVPWYTTDKALYLSPAWLMAAFEGIFEGDFLRAGLPLLAALGLALGLSLLYWLARAIFVRNAKEASA